MKANIFQTTCKVKVINYPDEIHAGMDLVNEENHDNPKTHKYNLHIHVYVDHGQKISYPTSHDQEFIPGYKDTVIRSPGSTALNQGESAGIRCMLIYVPT